MIARRIPVRASAAAVAVALGALASGTATLPAPFQLPRPAVAVVFLVLAALPMVLERWEVALGGFLVWLLVEDLVRKAAGNDLSVYFVKDVLFMVLVAALALDPRSRGAWRRAAGGTRIPLYLLLTWAVVRSIPLLAEDWRLPMLALRLDFLYLPLAAVGYIIARRADSLRRWLERLSIFLAAATSVGIVQAVVGPGFLAPDEPTPGLGLLVTVRGLPGSDSIYRPSGTFVSSGRFGALAVLALAIALGAVLAARRRSKAGLALSTLAAGGGVWISGGRAGFVVGAGLVAVAALAPLWRKGRGELGRSVVVGSLAVVLLMVLAAMLPSLFSSRLSWYSATLDPRSPESEWVSRWTAHAQDTVRGIGLGGIFGQGTGQESLGKQYLSEDPDHSPAGLYQVEAGFGAVAVEWGLVGLSLWLGWTVAWIWRQWRAVRAARDGPLGAAGMLLFAWIVLLLFVQFFGGLATFQNYLVNAYFWLLSGMIFALPEAAAAARLEAGANE
jgi:hypothetical protein